MKTKTMRGNSLTSYRDEGNERERERRGRGKERENSIYLRV
jgi:hypothetical protein